MHVRAAPVLLLSNSLLFPCFAHDLVRDHVAVLPQLSPLLCCRLYQVSTTHASFARYIPAQVGTSRGISPEQAKHDVVELCKEYGNPAPAMAAALDPAGIHVGELWHMLPSKVWMR